jgi:hypothetical protein
MVSLIAIVVGACAYAIVLYGVARFFSLTHNPNPNLEEIEMMNETDLPYGVNPFEPRHSFAEELHGQAMLERKQPRRPRTVRDLLAWTSILNHARNLP